MDNKYLMPKQEPIAVVGSSCRFTGGATSPHKLWNILLNPQDLSTEVPSERFNSKAFFHQDHEYHGTTNAPKAYWLDQDRRAFDASFFHVTPREAEAIDPQQRVLLEVSYEAFESAGYTLDEVSGQSVAVFAGVMTQDYDTISQRDDLFASQYSATGNAAAILSNRISYFFNLNGPSITINTACSASLVALNQAVLGLRARDFTMAVVAGVNLILAPGQAISESNLHMLSPTGHSRMWDAGADGYARGEGAAVLILKPLSNAIEDGDHIKAVIRETAVNSDGRTKGITMPSPTAQAALIRKTYLKTGLDPKDPKERCQYFEAHGTGTPAGDPCEAEAIADAFFGDVPSYPLAPPGSYGARQKDDGQSTVIVGSVKTVIGHTEGAAGLAGIFKVIQAMQHRQIPANLHLAKLNPNVAPFCQRLKIPTTTTPWPDPAEGQPRRASVNSFGFGGTNAHVIVEEYTAEIHNEIGRFFDQAAYVASFFASPEKPKQAVVLSSTPVTLPLLFSAHSQLSLVQVLKQYRSYLVENPTTPLQKLAWHLYASRTAHSFRLAIPCGSVQDVLGKMDALLMTAERQPTAEIGTRSRSSDNDGPRIFGIFTGQGAQWATMGRGLYFVSDVFRARIKALDMTLQQCPNPPAWSLEKELLAEGTSSRVSVAEISQPLCTALQVALVDLLQGLGVTFSCVVGHSSGEIAAAYAAGRLNYAEAILISYYRGKYAHLACGPAGCKGRMLAVGLSRQEAVDFCRRPEYSRKICMAASNGPSSVTLSGNVDAIMAAQEELGRQGKFVRLLQVDTAYHSHHMFTAVDEYSEALKQCDIKPSPADIGTVWVSSVHGAQVDITSERLRSKYWRENMILPVLFHEAVGAALREFGPFDCAIELGPHPALKGPFNQSIAGNVDPAMPYLGLLDRKKSDGVAFAEFLGSMWTAFGPSSVCIRDFVANSSQPSLLGSHLSNAPSYPWDHSQVFWRESRLSEQYHYRTHAPHELLGFRTLDDNQFALRWRNILKLDKVPWIEHHKFQGQALLPASAYCIMALDAARVLLNGRPASTIELRDLEFTSGITVEHGTQGVEILFTLTVEAPETARGQETTIEATFSLASTPLASFNSPPMKKNFQGRLSIVLEEPSPDALPRRPSVPRAEVLPVNVDDFYKMTSAIGLDYTGPFRAIRSIDRRYNFVSARLPKVHPDDTTSLSVSPAILDSCFQSLFATFSSPGDKALWTPFLPTNIDRMRFNLAVCDTNGVDDHVGVDSHLTNFKPFTSDSPAMITADLDIYNSDGTMSIQVENLRVSSFASSCPEDDYELYLHTVTDIDPEDEIISASAVPLLENDPVLDESCQRVAAFYKSKLKRVFSVADLDLSPSALPLPYFSPLPDYTRDWPTAAEDEEMDEFVKSSPYSLELEHVRFMVQTLPWDAVPGEVAELKPKAMHVHHFKKHLGRIVKQIAHRYPRMHILGLTVPELGANGDILDGLQDSFVSYTIGPVADDNLTRILSTMPEARRQKVITKTASLEADVQEDGQAQYDLVIVSTSYLDGQHRALALKKIRALMTGGGFLILVNIPHHPLKDKNRRATGLSRSKFDSPLTPPDWPDVLTECDFVETARNANQQYSLGMTIHIRQASCADKQVLQDPVLFLSLSKVTDTLLIIGPPLLGMTIQGMLQHNYTRVFYYPTIGDVLPAAISSCTAVIFLEDLHSPVCTSMTQKKLDNLKSLVSKPEMVILWVTSNAVDRDPARAASFGLTRTLKAEAPSLVLQVLDLEVREGAEQIIVESFLRLCQTALAEHNSGGFLWTHEPEVHMENGRRLVPRVLPYKPANDRVNAYRRCVEETYNSLNTPVKIVSSRAGTDGMTRYTARLHKDDESVPDQHLIHVDYSSLEPVHVGPLGSSYICIGRNARTGEVVAGLSRATASITTIPSRYIQPLHNPTDEQLGHLILALPRAMYALGLASQAERSIVVIVSSDSVLLKCIVAVCSGPFSKKGIELRSWSPQGDNARPESVQIHPRTSTRDLKRLFPASGADIVDFCSPDGSHWLSRKLQDSLPINCFYRSGVSLSVDQDVLAAFNTDLENRWASAVMMACGTSSLDVDAELCSPMSLLQRAETTPMPPFIFVDWTANRQVSILTKPIVEERLLRPDRTYVLIGLTRDLGQSLCRLFVDHGARNIIVASRNPDMSPNWVHGLMATYGANILVERCDITDMNSVAAFRARIDTKMPPVAGVVNGAMVLGDRVFTEMDLMTWDRVTRPKTVGSKNLDEVFNAPDMEFFIMTSSFAAIGGHGGQSNYAAANMYMNGLAADRRRRGLAGSVLNIGVIYGLGLLARERRDIYGGLEREGYPPISERDIHHMFLEAVVAGRPVPGQIMDLTTGLSRYRVNDPNPLHWHRDLRFSHFTVDDSASGEGGDTDNHKQTMKELIAACHSGHEVAKVIATALCRRLETSLQLPANTVTGDNVISELGVDSLAAVEIRNWFYKTVGQDLPLMKILGSSSISKLCQEISEKMPV